MSQSFEQMKETFEQMESILSLADRCAVLAIQRCALGRLRSLSGGYVGLDKSDLTALKRELRNWDCHRNRWK